MIKALIKGIFKFIYKILSLVNLQPAIVVSLIGILLYFTGVVDKYYAIKFILEIAMVISAIYAIFATLGKLLGISKKVAKKRGAQIVSQNEKRPPENQDDQEKAAAKEIEAPVYYKIKNKPDYVMAEYSDKYELFKISDDGLKKIRTDYKN